jgi:Uma2 family endonuclease
MAAVHERTGMPLSEYLEQSSEAPFEIINGERIPRLPNPVGHSYLIRLLMRLFETVAQFGEAFSETTYILPDRYDSHWVTGSRIPDVMYIDAGRWASYIANNSDWKEKPLVMVPDVVIEVISATDRYTKIEEKVDAYLADGVRLIVIIDPFTRKTVTYAPDAEQPLHLSGDAQLDFSEVIPGFQISLPSLFE